MQFDTTHSALGDLVYQLKSYGAVFQKWTAQVECERNLVSPAGMVETPRLQAKRRAW